MRGKGRGNVDGRERIQVEGEGVYEKLRDTSYFGEGLSYFVLLFVCRSEWR